MPIVDITASDDKRLINVAPEFLKGQQCAAKRVRWAIGEYLRILESEPKPETARNAGTPGEGDGADATHIR